MTPTWAGRDGVLANADHDLHLAYLNSMPGARVSLCGYAPWQLREASPAELRRAPRLCPVCIEHAYTRTEA